MCVAISLNSTATYTDSIRRIEAQGNSAGSSFVIVVAVAKCVSKRGRERLAVTRQLCCVIVIIRLPLRLSPSSSSLPLPLMQRRQEPKLQIDDASQSQTKFSLHLWQKVTQARY